MSHNGLYFTNRSLDWPKIAQIDSIFHNFLTIFRSAYYFNFAIFGWFFNQIHNLRALIPIVVKASSKIFKSMIFGLGFTLLFFTKQPIRMASTYNQLITYGCFSISPTKSKILVLICKHKGKKKTRNKAQERDTNQEGNHRFLNTKHLVIFSPKVATFSLLSHTNQQKTD